jgi:AcrR family transcriptional regulator
VYPVRQAMIPATPSTLAQRGRYDRVLQVATAMLSAGGEDMLQMKELSQRADVSLATLYRYFPSKDHVLLAIAYNRYEWAMRRVLSEPPHGATVRERVTNHLLREFRAGQRDQKLTAAMHRVMSDTGRQYSDIIERILHLHMKVLRYVAEAGGTLSEQQRRLLPVAVDTCGAANQRWLTGVSSAAEARFEIRIGCRVLDLPDSAVDDDLEQAAAPSGALVP